MSPDLDSNTPPPSADDALWEAIGRYFAGESDPAETARVEQWLAENPGARFVRRLDGAVQGITADLDRRTSNVDVEGALGRVAGIIDAEATEPTLTVSRTTAGRKPFAPVVRPPRSSGHFIVLGLAAAAAILIVAKVTLKKPAAPTTIASAARTITTPVGGRDSVTLSDGSRVVIGPASSLTIPADYGVASRELTLDGRAYFDVKHDNAKALTIRAGDATIRDIGTSFDVSSDSVDGVFVAVTSGVVELTSASQAVRLEAGQAGGARRGAPPSRPRRVDATDTAWVAGRMQFMDAPMSRVASDLRRFHGTIVVFADSAIARLPFRGAFEIGTPVEVAHHLGLILGVNASVRGDTVILAGAPRRK